MDNSSQLLVLQSILLDYQQDFSLEYKAACQLVGIEGEVEDLSLSQCALILMELESSTIPVVWNGALRTLDRVGITQDPLIEQDLLSPFYQESWSDNPKLKTSDRTLGYGQFPSVNAAKNGTKIAEKLQAYHYSLSHPFYHEGKLRLVSLLRTGDITLTFPGAVIGLAKILTVTRSHFNWQYCVDEETYHWCEKPVRTLLKNLLRDAGFLTCLSYLNLRDNPLGKPPKSKRRQRQRLMQWAGNQSGANVEKMLKDQDWSGLVAYKRDRE